MIRETETPLKKYSQKRTSSGWTNWKWAIIYRPLGVRVCAFRVCFARSVHGIGPEDLRLVRNMSGRSPVENRVNRTPTDDGRTSTVNEPNEKRTKRKADGHPSDVLYRSNFWTCSKLFTERNGHKRKATYKERTHRTRNELQTDANGDETDLIFYYPFNARQCYPVMCEQGFIDWTYFWLVFFTFYLVPNVVGIFINLCGLLPNQI